MKVIVPTGIGDSVWALHKVQAIRDRLDPDGAIDIRLACGNDYTINPIESRALDFVRRFPFISSAEMLPFSIHNPPWHLPSGLYNYIEDGMYDIAGEPHCVLIPNATLERGERLESWLPQYAIDWSIFADFHISDSERQFAEAIRYNLGSPFAVFYPGPLNGNTHNGHNRNALWAPQQWITLGRHIRREFGLPIVIVGAPYDAPYYNHLLSPELNGCGSYWHNFIGQTTIGQLFALISLSRFVISYQAGVGIVSTYLNIPTGIFWRPQGDSISPDVYLSFDERMASAWVPPRTLASGGHLPLIYGRHDEEYIMNRIKERQWID